ncbi:Uncharacterised protein [Vibrio cholerae]|nr:Uncharacterised protein [Vibrio cholerae]
MFFNNKFTEGAHFLHVGSLTLLGRGYAHLLT